MGRLSFARQVKRRRMSVSDSFRTTDVPLPKPIHPVKRSHETPSQVKLGAPNFLELVSVVLWSSDGKSFTGITFTPHIVTALQPQNDT